MKIIKMAKKAIWVLRCANLVRACTGWKRSLCFEYAESLYQTYRIEDDYPWTPADALDEDRSYWGD